MLCIYIKPKNFNLIWFLLCSIFFCNSCYGDAENEDQITYYENLITTEIDKAFHYTLPTSAEEYRPKHNCSPKDFGTYDFVVVGAGPGGSVIANRLSEVKNWNVLLIEAGGPESNFSNIPGTYFYLQGSRFNWNFKTTPQNTSCLGNYLFKLLKAMLFQDSFRLLCSAQKVLRSILSSMLLGMINKVCHVPRGKALGGSSAINSLAYCRGNKNDYDRWGKDNDGWSYHEVLPYFIKSENEHVNGDPGYHGLDGYWNVKYHTPDSGQLKAILEGSNLIYKSTSKDYNGREQLGAFRIQINNRKQFRDSANKAFLQPIRDRPNLKILTHSYVTKIMIHPKTKTAYGVKFTQGGKAYFVKTRKEVIISAGSINSPQILMLSGIGPQQHLKEMNIPVIHNLPAGRTLYDHSLFYGLFVTSNITEPEFVLRESVKQFLNDSGPLTVSSNNQGIGYYRSSFESNLNYPDIELKFHPAGGVPNKFIRQTLGVTDDVYNALFKNINIRTTMNVFLFGLRTQAVGKITLGSKNPFQYPVINTNLLDNEHDVETMYEAIEILKKILKTQPLQKINASLFIADYPQCRDYTMGSKDHWICALRLLTSSGYHQTSTCRMGPNPTDSVVDNKAKVHGITNLRVVDASIIPFPVAGHTDAPTTMVGEKVSDIIKLDHGLKIDPITNVNNN